jgi:dipeptidyl aminopeptidase/acylaminoacyl peptidase
MRFIIISFIVLLTIQQYPLMAESTREEQLKQDSAKILDISKNIAEFYELPDGLDIQEITEKLLTSPYVRERQKNSIVQESRRIFVFSYPSDGLKIKGFISFVPHPDKNPTLILLRGGNREFGLHSPGSDISCVRRYTVISTTYRGGISEGQDEFGGNDVNDVKNLIDYIPELERKLGMAIQNEKMHLLGGSRGGMQMFLVLARFPEIQKKITKIVSLSGLLDMRFTILDRVDMKNMFIEDFGLVENDPDQWIDHRDPLLAAKKLRADLPVLIIQGLADIRSPPDEGYNMIRVLESNGNPVTYLEFVDGEHCLTNRSDRMELIADWLEKE